MQDSPIDEFPICIIWLFLILPFTILIGTLRILFHFYRLKIASPFQTMRIRNASCSCWTKNPNPYFIVPYKQGKSCVNKVFVRVHVRGKGSYVAASLTSGPLVTRGCSCVLLDIFKLFIYYSIRFDRK